MTTLPDTILESIQKAIRLQIEKIVEQEINNALTVVESRIRADTGTIAANVMTHFTIERYSPQQIKIVVNFDNTRT